MVVVALKPDTHARMGQMIGDGVKHTGTASTLLRDSNAYRQVRENAD